MKVTIYIYIYIYINLPNSFLRVWSFLSKTLELFWPRCFNIFQIFWYTLREKGQTYYECILCIYNVFCVGSGSVLAAVSPKGVWVSLVASLDWLPKVCISSSVLDCLNTRGLEHISCPQMNKEHLILYTVYCILYTAYCIL